MDRVQYFCINENVLELPVFFPSISSVKSSRRPVEYAMILNGFRNMFNNYLVSAFDIEYEYDKTTFYKILENAKNDKCSLLLDSGNYESYWLRMSNSWLRDSYHAVASTLSAPLAFSFDNQAPSTDIQVNIKETIKYWDLDQKAIPLSTVIPIIHGEIKHLSNLIYEVAKHTGVNYIAVPERELGNTITERCFSIRNIRKQLNLLDRYIILHILGTGNPLTIALYSYEGADSFDGLEWCQNVVDFETGNLHHISHAELYLLSSIWNDIDTNYYIKTIAHNLQYFSSWIDGIRSAKRNNIEIEYLREKISPLLFQYLNKKMGWLSNEY